MGRVRRDKRKYPFSRVGLGMLLAFVGRIVIFGGGCGDNYTSSSGGHGGETAQSNSSSSSSSDVSSSGGGYGGEGGSIVSSSSASSSSSSSGSGTCFGDTDCNGFDGCVPFVGAPCDCYQIACQGGQCAPINPLPEGALANVQIIGDCQKQVCDGLGKSVSTVDSADADFDNDDCTDDICANGVTTHPPSAEGTPCSKGLCDGQGNCIQCVDTTQCSDGTICIDSHCTLPTCKNNNKDDNESDVDCGLSCPPCAKGHQCTTNSDCQSGICFQNVCD